MYIYKIYDMNTQEKSQIGLFETKIQGILLHLFFAKNHRLTNQFKMRVIMALVIIKSLQSKLEIKSLEIEIPVKLKHVNTKTIMVPRAKILSKSLAY